MKRRITLDTGPLVALLHRRDFYHNWAVEQFPKLGSPLLTCKSVLSEACHLLRGIPRSTETVLKLMETGLVQIAFDLSSELSAIRKLADRYSNVPMSLADACLVRMSELHHNSTIFTTDSDFHIYRKHNNQPIPLIIPA